ncbi:hypothetical protein LCGC14_3016480, partial [marine sediment metagenome]
MPGPTIMAHQYRQAAGNSIARIVRGGSFQELLGTTGITGTSAAPMNDSDFLVRSTMCRYQGRVYVATRTDVKVLDEITGLWVNSYTYNQGGAAGVENPCQLLTAGRFLVACYSRDQTGGNRQVVYVRKNAAGWNEIFSGSSVDNPPTPLKSLNTRAASTAGAVSTGSPLRSSGPLILRLSSSRPPASSEPQTRISSRRSSASTTGCSCTTKGLLPTRRRSSSSCSGPGFSRPPS